MTEAVLVDNLLKTFPNDLSGLTSEMKDRILKERIALTVDEIVTKLNEVYDNVTFFPKWSSAAFEDGFTEGGQSAKKGFDDHEQSDSMYWGKFDEYDDEDYWRLNQLPLNEISIALYFIHIEKCNLGHIHRTKRFYYYSIPRIMTMISFYFLDKKIDHEFVKTHVPNFFDVEPKSLSKPSKPKRGSKGSRGSNNP